MTRKPNLAVLWGTLPSCGHTEHSSDPQFGLTKQFQNFVIDLCVIIFLQLRQFKSCSFNLLG